MFHFTCRQHRFAHMTSKVRGFTLIEVMITVAIIGILASIAYPSYQEYVIKSRRASAQSFLMDVLQRQQQYLLDTREFAADLATLGMALPSDLSGYYQVKSITRTSPPPVVVVTLEAVGPQAKDGDLALSSTGSKTGKW